MRYDVIVVGARCAGAPLATLLARRGLRVAVVERATFPRDTPSTHVFEANGLAFLRRLGVIDRIRDTGAPFAGRTDIRLEGFRCVTRLPQIAGAVGGVASVRRPLLAPILADAAQEAGAEMMFGTTVTGLLERGGRTAGVHVRNGSPSTLEAPLVVGADGRNSTV